MIRRAGAAAALAALALAGCGKKEEAPPVDAAAEKAAATERARTDKRIVGRAVVRSQHWNDSPRSRELRRGLDPRVACKNTWRRIEALARNKAWLEGYRRARAAFVAGVHATFPAGTYWLQRHAGVVCDPIANN